MSATPQDVLREAARILMRDGWTQKSFGDAQRGRCAIGAMRAANDTGKNGIAAEMEAEDRLAWLLVSEGVVPTNDGTFATVALWNDAPERTAEDVILALKRAAEES